jgi:hypothetical protein
MGPAPSTSTAVSAPTPARRHACTPTLSGSHIAPSSSPTPSGSRKQRSAGCTTRPARHPCTGGVAKNRMSSHRLYRPPLQWPQRRQLMPGSSATRSPADRCVTPGPTSSTTPAHSCPITIGSSTTKCAMRISLR